MHALASLQRAIFRCAFFLFVLLPLGAAAQVALDNSIQTFPTLAGTTVTMTGRSELRITGAGTPISGCTINLNSADSWLFFTNVKPSVVNTATYLNQIKVSGAAAVLNTNVRVVQFGEGAVVIPHAPGFAPLTVFSGTHFTGPSLALTNYTAYGSTTLGAFNDRISSFKLKRGYTATLAQNSAGSGASRNYVAADGDLEIAMLPAELDDAVSFVRVFPWRWTTKKGGANQTDLNNGWSYNWNIDQNSTLDREYVPIRAQRYWPGLSQNWQTRGANQLLGYNEPDHTDQANIAVGDAIWSWPDLLGTGLRTGSPAPSDGGLGWLYDFMGQAEAAALRVDFVAVHYYRCFNPANPAGAATQFFNFLKGIYDQTGRPIWITEWNNGANWTTCADPTFAQQHACIDAMTDMLENTAWVERYSIYSWVEEVRQMHYDAGGFTPAGTTYRDKPSRIGHQQVIPEAPSLAGAFYRFENDARDTSAYGHAAITKGAATFTAGHAGKAVVMSGDATSADHVQLSPRMGDCTDFTFGAWVYWGGGANWQRVFDLGAGTGASMFLTPKSSAGTMRFTINSGSGDQQLNHSAALPVNVWTHVAVTISGSTGKLFVNGALAATNSGMTINPADLATTANYLGKSQFSADPFFAGRLDDVQFLPYALTDAQVFKLTTNTPPVFTSASISGGTATQGVAYSGTLAGTATDADAGDTITFSKVAGPAWLSVAANGALSGTPGFDDSGAQEFTVQVADSAGATAVALLTITLPSVSGNGTWSVNADGNWSDTTKWSGAHPASGAGFIADFSTLDISPDRIVTLDASRTVGTLKFGDLSGTRAWTLDGAAGRTLTLQSTSGTPSIVVQNIVTLAASLDGAGGFAKSGAGTLVLRGDNSITGTVAMDTGSTTANEGVVRLAHPQAASGVTTFTMTSNNAGRSTLELDGAFGNINSPAAITLSGRTNTTPAVINLSGTNQLSGGLSIGSGGSSYIFQSDAGTLTLDGPITSAATGSRTFTFQGAGNFTLAGPIANGSATTGIALVKTGAGTLTLSGANTHTGATTISGGTLALGHNIALGTGTLNVSGGTVQNSGGTRTIANNLAVAASTTTNLRGTGTASASDFYADGDITGSGSLDLSGTLGISRLRLRGDNAAFTGTATVSGVNVSLDSVTAGSAAAAWIVNSGLHLNATGAYHLGALSGSGSIGIRNSSTAVTAVLSVGAKNTSTTFSGTLTDVSTVGNTGGTGTVALTKVGTGSLTLSGSNGYTGATTISAGKLILSGTNAGSITATTGTLSASGTPGTTGSVAIQSGARFETNLTAAGAGQLNVGGSVTLAGALDVVAAPGLPPGTTFTILNKTSAGAVSGIFTGKPHAAAFSASGYVWLISYTGGDGNDVTLTTATAQQTWRFQSFGTINATGSAADTADPNGDGEANLLEFATAQNPNAATRTVTSIVANGADLEFTYTRSNAALADGATFTVIWSDTLAADSWSSAGVSEQLLSDNGTVQTVRATLPAGGSGRFVRLSVVK